MRKTKPEILEEKLNSIEGYPLVWVYREGKQYIIQDQATGNVIKNFYSYAAVEEYIFQMEEKYSI